MSTSPNLAIIHVEDGMTNKEPVVDEAIDILDEAMNDNETLVITGNTTVTAAQFTQNVLLILDDVGGSPTSPSAAFNLTVPDTKRKFIVRNITGFTATVKNSTGSTYALVNGATAVLYSTGTGILLISTNLVTFTVAASDEITALAAGTAKLTFRMPYAMSLLAVRSSLSTVSSSGLVTVDINESGGTILSTKLSIDQGEKTSVTAATPAVISDAALADDAEITIDIDAAGTGATGLKVTLIGTRA